MTARRLYIVPFPLRRTQISAWCWGPGCGKGCIGALTLDGYEFMACVEADCPHMDKQMSKPIGTIDDGSEVYPRKLKDVTP